MKPYTSRVECKVSYFSRALKNRSEEEEEDDDERKCRYKNEERDVVYDVHLLARECKIYISNMTSKESSSASFDDDEEEEEEERARTKR